MFEELSKKLDGAIRRLRGRGKLTEKDVAESIREIRGILLEADVHYKVVKDFLAAVEEKALGQEVIQNISPGHLVVKIVHDEMVKLLGRTQPGIKFGHVPPSVIMLAGLQGSGKTSFAAKLALHLQKQKHGVLLVAADKTRPAAVDQLVVLGESIGVPVLADDLKPVELAKLSIPTARKRALDVVIIDTAGRLHVDESLMDELAEIQKAVGPTEILFVADGMTGQDAVKSAQAFAQKLPVTGIVLTKMDGDARGGAALSVRAVTGCPIKFVAAGEKPDALEAFHPDRMASRILGMGDIVTLVEKAQQAVDLDKAAEFGSKLKSGLDFDDLRDQLRQLKKMGPLGQLAQMIPGAGRLGDMNVDESRLAKVEAIIGSMTLEERSKPHLLNGSRRRRIALGSGTRVEDVNQLCRQLQMMQKMTRQMGKMGMKKMRRSMPISF